jgi:FKBP-type peptidyl-prolyl cis-trans isomerase FklB
MKVKNLFLLIAGTAILLSSCDQKMTGNTKLESDVDSISYLIGVDIGTNLKNASLEEINYTNFINGIEDAFEKKDLEIDEKEIKPYIQQFFQKLQAKQEEIDIAKGKVNLEEGRAFLEENKKREGVIVDTTTGLQYEIIKEGTGKSPSNTDVVTCHYHGTTIDGTVFDSSIDRGTPAEFALNRVIPGWQEGIPLMKVGAKYKFYIPSELAYGTRGMKPKIEQNMTLIFEVELLEVKTPEQKEN